MQFQETPNPNALKCVVGSPIPPISDQQGPRSYGKSADVSKDPLARELLAIDGVANILISGTWITVNREPGAEWKPIKSAVQAVLKRFGSPAGEKDPGSEGA